MQPIIEVKNLVKNYGKVKAVDNMKFLGKGRNMLRPLWDRTEQAKQQPLK